MFVAREYRGTARVGDGEKGVDGERDEVKGASEIVAETCDAKTGELAWLSSRLCQPMVHGSSSAYVSQKLGRHHGS